MCCHCKGHSHTKKLACGLANILTSPALVWENLLVSIDTPHKHVFLEYAQMSMASLGTPSELHPQIIELWVCFMGLGCPGCSPRPNHKGQQLDSSQLCFTLSTSCQLVLSTQLQRCFSPPSEA